MNIKKFAFDFFAPTTTCLAVSSAVAISIISPPTQAQVPNPPVVNYALIAQDHVALRNAPRDAAPQQAQLWQGELVELRGERLNYVQVWDTKRERGGFVRMSQIRKVSFTPDQADALLAVLRFVKDSPGSEGLTFGYGAAWLKAATTEQARGSSGAQVLDAIGSAADRLANRASTVGFSKSTQESITAQLDAAQRYGIRFESIEQVGRMRVCYDGDLYARVLMMPSASSEHKAKAALALTRTDCDDPQLALKNPLEQAKREEQRAALLDKAETTNLPPYLLNRLQMRRASVWSVVAFDRARQGVPTSQHAAQRALDALAVVNKTELPDDDMVAYNDTIMRVNASRWAATPTSHLASSGNLTIRLEPSAHAGETCVNLMNARQILAKRCTYGVVWTASWSVNREANAAALAVQSLSSWRELWVFRKQAGQWTIDVLPPAATEPDLGYAELAGWIPGGESFLVAREARGEGKYKLSYEVVDLATLTVKRQASDASVLGPFQRWQQPQWKQHSVSLR